MLHYITEQTEETVDLLSSDAWSTLGTGHSYGKAANVGPVVFDGSVTITQKGKGCKYILTWTPQHYTMCSAETGPKRFDPIWVQLKPGKERSIEISGDEVAARELPLAKCHESFKYFKLTMLFKDMDNTGGLLARNPQGVCDHLKVSAPSWLFNSIGCILTQDLGLQYLLIGRPGLEPQAIGRRILRVSTFILQSDDLQSNEA